MSNSLPTELYSTTQIKELEKLIMKQDAIDSFALMNRAGKAVFRCLRDKWATARNIVVFCGVGNNAGDGYIVANLALSLGWKVCVYSVVDPQQLKGDAQTAYQNYIDAQGTIRLFQRRRVIHADVIIDALLGTGLNRTVTDIYAVAIDTINQSKLPVLAVDCPSGLQADTGNVLGHAIKASYTVTFIGLKGGLFTGFAAQYCGELIYAPLTKNEQVFKQFEAAAAARMVPRPLPPRDRCTHKGHYGHVLIVGGDFGYMGAVRLAAEAALRVGAGLVSIATHIEHTSALTSSCPELMCHEVNNAQQLKELMDKASVIVLGPGLGQNHWSKALLKTIIKTQKPLIIDADGLNLLATAVVDNLVTTMHFQKTFQMSAHGFPINNHPLAATLQPATSSQMLKLNWILTPHPGEAARLLGCSTLEIQKDRFTAARALHTKYHGSVVVLKGSGTLIASEQGVVVNNTGNPGMATGGMGDVLAGVIAGLVAQGLSLVQAAEQGVYGHGLAADWAAAQDGERGLLASDLLPYLRRWVNSR